jgi:hypothetical protein
MLRRLGTFVCIAAATMTIAGAGRTRSVPGTCAPRDKTSDRLAATFKDIVTRTTKGGIVIKTQLGIASVSPSQIAAVTDKAICAKAADAMHAQVPAKHASYTLYIVTLGTSYGVLDNTITEPGKSLAYVFDHNWKYVGNQAL